MIRPGDEFEAEVTKVRPLTSAPRHIADKIRLVHLIFETSNRLRPFYVQVSWSIEKLGGLPMVGDRVVLKAREPFEQEFSAARGRPVGLKFWIKKRLKGENTMNNVRFFLAHRYFTGSKSHNQNGMSKETCIDVLTKAFGSPGCGRSSWGSYMIQSPNGFHIVCREEQFARFIVYRHETNECINGIRDLQPEIISAREDVFAEVDDMCQQAGVDSHFIRKVLAKLNIDRDTVEACVAVRDDDVEIDVSGN